MINPPGKFQERKLTILKVFFRECSTFNFWGCNEDKQYSEKVSNKKDSRVNYPRYNLHFWTSAHVLISPILRSVQKREKQFLINILPVLIWEKWENELKININMLAVYGISSEKKYFIRFILRKLKAGYSGTQKIFPSPNKILLRIIVSKNLLTLNLRG